jgi:hypothetical protein
MRSLEKVAQEKGLVKQPTVLEKIASRPAVKKLDVTPTSSMMDNIFKLSAGLRAQGLVKEAAELETNYFNFKQAQTLYEAHKEKGEDVIHSAHPKGSHKLEGVEGQEATFEDILDKHTKFLDMVGKKPTGKLESTAHILSEVKKALAQETKYDPKMIAYWFKTQTLGKLERALRQAEGALAICQRAVKAGFMVQSQTFGKDYEDLATAVQGANNAWQKMHTERPTVEGANAMVTGISDALSYVDEAFSTDEKAEALKDEASGAFKGAIRTAKSAIVTIQDFNSDPNSLPSGVIPPSTEGTVGATSGKQGLTNRLTSLMRSLNYYKSILPTRIAPRVIPQAQSIINNYSTQINALLTYLKDASDQEASQHEQDVKNLEGWVNGFATSWKLASGSPAPTGGTPIASR